MTADELSAGTPLYYTVYNTPLMRPESESRFLFLSVLVMTVTIAAVAVFLYAWLVPLGVWGFLTWRQNAARQTNIYSFLETVCVYGYSLFIYIPTSVSSSSFLYRFVILQYSMSLVDVCL